MEKGERSPDFQADSGTDLGPTGNLHLTQKSHSLGLDYFSFAVGSCQGVEKTCVSDAFSSKSNPFYDFS